MKIPESRVKDNLEAFGIRCETGGHKPQTFEGAELIVTSPGIPLDMEFFKLARDRGILITGELDIFSFFLTKPLVAITGTNGKTTVTTLISEMLTQSGFQVFTGGNIGTPLVKFLESGQKQDIVVAEVSSFQLDTARHFSPNVAVLLNIAQDHMDRYTDFSAYIKSKLGIFNDQSKDSFAIVNQSLSDLPDLQEIAWEKNIPGTILTFGHGEGDARNPGPGLCNAFAHTTAIDITGTAGARYGSLPQQTMLPQKQPGLLYEAEADFFVLDLSFSRLKGSPQPGKHCRSIPCSPCCRRNTGWDSKGCKPIFRTCPQNRVCGDHQRGGLL